MVTYDRIFNIFWGSTHTDTINTKIGKQCEWIRAFMYKMYEYIKRCSVFWILSVHQNRTNYLLSPHMPTVLYSFRFFKRIPL